MFYLIWSPGGSLRIFEWGCAAGTLETLVYTRAISAEFCYPILDLSPQIPPNPRVSFRLSCVNLNLPIKFFYIFEWQFPVSLVFKIFNQLISFLENDTLF